MSESVLFVPITPIDSIMREARTDQLRSVVETSLMEHYNGGWGDSRFRVHVSSRSDYEAVKIFVAQPELIPDVEAFAEKLGDELRNDGIHAFFYVRPWLKSAEEGSIAP